MAPRLAEVLEGPAPLVRALFIAMTIGLVWQFVMVVLVVRWEQGSLRWTDHSGLLVGDDLIHINTNTFGCSQNVVKP